MARVRVGKGSQPATDEQTPVVEEMVTVVEQPVTASEQAPNIPEGYITVAQAAKRLNTSYQQVYQRAIMNKRMTVVEAGKKKYVPVDQVDAWGAERQARRESKNAPDA